MMLYKIYTHNGGSVVQIYTHNGDDVVLMYTHNSGDVVHNTVCNDDCVS